jgi:phosphoribosyl-ATP pyrophosphohydrolase/phosphoribosyl-AMP cyclohydrolase/histidinol dehydrogenase
MSRTLRWATTADVVSCLQPPVTAADLAAAAELVERVRVGGEPALRQLAQQFDGLAVDAPLTIGREQLDGIRAALPVATVVLLERTAARIRAFATAQRACLLPLATAVPGGRAGHRWLPVAAAGAYAPGGRYPLPSSVLMTVVPAKVAGVPFVRVASPRPSMVTLAAAAVAGADEVLVAGGAQAIAALAVGVAGPRVDVVVGPGNRWVTAAKKHLVGEVGIDGLAGPSELLVLADADADPAAIAADLLAQAEHDPDARPLVVATSADLLLAVERELLRQLATLPTAAVARASLQANGCLVQAFDLADAVAFANRVAPEHLELCVRDPSAVVPALHAYGALFVGTGSAEVFGDYGAGPNHVLPTGGGARFQAGLSVATFLRPATWLELDDPSVLAADIQELAQLEGLHGHAAAAALRAPSRPRW